MTSRRASYSSTTETHGDLARVVNAMMFAEGGDDVEQMFDGAGTQWPGAWLTRSTVVVACVEQVYEVISGACAFCSHAFDAETGRYGRRPSPGGIQGTPSVRRIVRRAGGPHVLSPGCRTVVDR